MKKYIVNLKGGKPRSIEVSQEDYHRISGHLLREGAGRVVIHERLESGTRTHFVAPSQITSLEETTEEDWP